MKGILIVLGAPNSDTGELSEIARNRLDGAIRFYLNNPGFKILCTGGFGPHFNTTDTPHARYAISYLQAHNIPEEDITEFALSSNTQQDAIQAKPIVDTYKPALIVVITSDFHIKRARLIFNVYFAGYAMVFLEAISTLDKATLDQLIAHEQRAIQQWQNNPF